jgi:hypothetical protein
MRPADRAWLVLATGVVAYEISADDLLSYAADRWMLKHPWLTRAAIASVALHLCNAIPERCDPLHYLFGVKRFARGADKCALRQASPVI